MDGEWEVAKKGKRRKGGNANGAPNNILSQILNNNSISYCRQVCPKVGTFDLNFITHILQALLVLH
jgi:hypothetical protein